MWTDPFILQSTDEYGIVLWGLAVKSIQLNDPKMRMTADQVELKVDLMVDLPIYS